MDPNSAEHSLQVEKFKEVPKKLSNQDEQYFEVIFLKIGNKYIHDEQYINILSNDGFKVSKY